MIFSNNHLVKNLKEELKEIKKVLKECNFWSKEKINLVCKKYFEKNIDNNLTR